MTREISIGIMKREDFQRHTLAIARGKHKPNKDEPKIWFDSVESMAQVLSTKNRELLRIIREEEPQSLTELAKATGRQTSNLSRTLKNMERYGFVELEKQSRSLRPSVLVDTFRAVFSF